jgi:SAM-dependent methyltransferase/glycosyltransferase involved in cell wall biosynthesis
MPTVSILIPAYIGTYLKRAIDSAVDQSFADTEILVGDDSKNGDLKALVTGLGNPKVKYFHHGFQDAVQNTRALWERASGQYVKWLYHDDILLRGSVEALVNALRAHPQAAFAFHERVFIDDKDAVTQAPSRLLGDGQTSLVDRALLVQKMIGTSFNFIGEPSNTMVEKSKVDVTRRQMYKSWRLQSLTDVTSYLNMTEESPAIAVGGYLSAFRQHGDQASNAQSPFFSAGVFEWELILRNEAVTADFSREILTQAQQRLHGMYQAHVGRLPELQGFLDGLHELTDCPSAQLADTPKFREALIRARESVAERIVASRSIAKIQKPAAETPSITLAHSPMVQMTKPATIVPTATHALPCVCSVCGQRVAQWQPHPRRDQRSPFMKLVEAVGSNLDRYECPNCHCNDRDRHLWLYMKHAGLLDDLLGKRVLHIAPEAMLEPRIRAMGPLEYIGGDLYPRLPSHQRVDVQALQFPDNHFDLIICNHVLEHVADPALVLSEFKRCLTESGHLVAQTPFSARLKHTLEMSGPVPADVATLYYGQDDHVRLFGQDIIDYFHAAGLHGSMVPHNKALENIDAQEWGVNEREPFFMFAKAEVAEMAV